MWDFLINGPDDQAVKEYFQFMLDIAVLIGADRATAEGKLRDVLNFEMDLAQIVTPDEVRKANLSQLYNTFTINELMSHPHLGWLNWAKYLNNKLSQSVQKIPNKVMIGNINYFIKLNFLLKKTRPEIMANFMVWRAITHVMPFLNSRILGRKEKLGAVFLGTQQRPERWQKCVSDITSLMKMTTSSMYVKTFINPKEKRLTEEMVAHISEEMLSTIQREEWMQFWTKGGSKLKMIAMKKWSVYPDQLLDPYEMKKYFRNLTMNMDHYFEAAIDIRKFENERMLSELNDNASDYREDWRQHTENYDIHTAHYTLTQNAIEIPGAILQPPFYIPEVPDYVNYASLGVIIAHEITHGFDNRGAKYNFLGNIENWWDTNSQNNFEKKLQCFIEQYGNFTDKTTKLKINGELTLGENVADQGGVMVTYNAYVNQQKGEPALPGLEHLDNKQMFLLVLANSWCNKMRPQTLEYIIKSSSHAPDEFRITGMIMNLEDFGDIYGCPVGSPMNPEKKCSLW